MRRTGALCGLWLGLLAAAPALAERPMAVDDAGVVDGHIKLELGRPRDGVRRGVDAVVGFSPLKSLEVEVEGERLRSRDPQNEPSERVQGLRVKWVTTEPLHCLTFGVRLDLQRLRLDEDPPHRETERGLVALATCTLDAFVFHANLGRIRVTGGDPSHYTFRGIGGEWLATKQLAALAEAFHDGSGRGLNRQVGLRWEVLEGVKLSVAAGRGNGRSFGMLAVAYEH